MDFNLKQFTALPRKLQNEIAEELGKKYPNTNSSQRSDNVNDILRYSYLREEYETYGEV